MQTIAESIIQFYTSLKAPVNLPRGVEVLHPQAEEQVLQVVADFYTRYYSDHRPRHLLIGINPGRFGAGTTGVNFTGPKQLTEYCGIQHPFGKRSELSAEFIYEMIMAYGGVEKFYGRFFITSVSPLGFTKNGINLNYYDDPLLASSLRPWIIEMFKQQLAFTGNQQACVCIGGEKNYKYLKNINDECRFFKHILPVAHPRFIMQYRRKQKESFVQKYLSVLAQLGH
ncbi:MAG TPA: uracil-DNA glycosylase family protein [Chitinophagaceae bacterium]|nr:uracil-DNA glycosylase family protein [Chitinophagaceae bacterium]